MQEYLATGTDCEIATAKALTRKSVKVDLV